MIHLPPGSGDAEFLADLKEAGILTPDVIERIDASLGRPENGTLDGFLVAGADFVRTDHWLSWLIRSHGCHRFGRVNWREEAAEWARTGAPSEANIPYRRCGDGSLLVAVLRPDRLPASAERWRTSRLLRAAATLGEIRELKSAWVRHCLRGEDAENWRG